MDRTQWFPERWCHISPRFILEMAEGYERYLSPHVVGRNLFLGTPELWRTWVTVTRGEYLVAATGFFSLPWATDNFIRFLSGLLSPC